MSVSPSRFTTLLLAMLFVIAAETHAAAVNFTVTLKVHNLDGAQLAVGLVEVDPTGRQPPKTLTIEDLQLEGNWHAGQDNVNRLNGPNPVPSAPDAVPVGAATVATYTLQLAAPDNSRVARIRVRLPGREFVDLNHLAAMNQTIDVSMPKEKPTCCVDGRRSCLGRVLQRFRRCGR